MPKYLTKEEAYSNCRKEGKINPVADVDFEKIKSMLIISESDLLAGQSLKKNNNLWNSVYKLHYDALHELVEAFLLFDKIKTDNHQCLFAYLCEKHPKLDFDWAFFEKVRTKRNGINYYGTPIIYQDFKEVEIQFVLYINKLKDEIKKRIG